MTNNAIKRTLAILLATTMLFQLTACSVVETAKHVVESTKDTVVNWYENIDLSAFKDGWNSAVAFTSSASATAMSSEYVASIETAITSLEADINAAAGNARGVAQQAGYAAEKWVAGTFNIDAIANGSDYRATTVNSNELGSVDVATNWGEEASLKYYQSGSDSAHAQAITLIERYSKYAHGKENPKSLQEYMDSNGYDNGTTI